MSVKDVSCATCHLKFSKDEYRSTLLALIFHQHTVHSKTFNTSAVYSVCPWCGYDITKERSSGYIHGLYIDIDIRIGNHLMGCINYIASVVESCHV